MAHRDSITTTCDPTAVSLSCRILLICTTRTSRGSLFQRWQKIRKPCDVVEVGSYFVSLTLLDTLQPLAEPVKAFSHGCG
ncbi:hypothetical protein MPTK1_4g01810 [Marchantia polymorpha subsp. ruderalis]|uniref:Uncharacterized protein n=2 Tax=Marchantia polymorpha TaxID=3197 RepID=A0AAF6B5A8_MARPO|nr:hypothetical protein MARPO_0098s0019 [Marchantia polymorpha]BBN07192.1 hypothetical protein Mp_4g01810 [Marchantia polymorpha subsp. ruderalis]PTQ32465.1 hypothetical protein MARPO_0098s0019 [Marchantia polymorpha]PTQ32466.1 hypothetical protein MARPO_0098s0019 [Marchantia polymorpha]PTQ32467.1 hypothetical protein MARPO_0098s0019 [Marchantia polymorpha]|eukprot:PTQ32464.1 hypothetical protein MARPO_0098s0019 [Marchantia polymorpha]